MAMVEEEEATDLEAFSCKLLNAVSACEGHTKYWKLLLACFPPPHQQASSLARSTPSTRLPVLLGKLGVLTKDKPPAEGKSTPPTIQQCVAEDINGAGEGEGSTLPRFTAIWPVGAVLCDLFSIVKGGDCTSIDRRLSSIGAALKANVAATLLDRLSRLEEEAAPELIDGFNKLYESCEFQTPRTDVTGAYYVTASLGKPSVLDAHLTLCPEGMKKETVLELDSGMGKDSGSVMCKTTPLGLAVLLDDVKLMEMLLAKGASPNDCSDSAFSALHLAVMMKKEKTLKLLSKQAPIEPLPCLHPLTAAVCLSSKDTVNTLLQNKAAAVEVNYLDMHTLCSPLMAAVSYGEVDKVKALLRKRADCNMEDSEGFTALFYAIYAEHRQRGTGLKMVSTLLAHCPSSVNCVGSRKLRPLHFAAYMGCPEVCKLLLKKGATPDSVDADGLNALHWAVLSKELTCVTLLLAHRGCSGLVRQVDNFGTSPLHLAAYLGFHEAAEMLLAKGAAVDFTCKDGSTPLVWAVAARRAEMAEVLIHKGAEVDLNPSPKDSPSCLLADKSVVPLQPLHVAARAGASNLVKLILREGAQVDTRGEDGCTALHHASVMGRLDCIVALLEAGAMVDALTARGETPLHLATMYSTGFAVLLLVDSGKADLSIKHPNLGSSVLHLSSMHGTSPCMKVLLDRNKCDVNAARLGDGYTPLHVAAAQGHLECAEHLLEHGAGVNNRDRSVEGCTPLDVALRESHTPVVDLLLQYGGCTRSGVHHRAACLIQAVWRFHVHKRRRRLAEKWSANVLQRSTGKWLNMKKAARLRLAQEMRRERSAKLIQHHWRRYITKKRRYEAQLVCLKSRIKHEKDAYSLILGEIHRQSKSITLPSPKAPSAVVSSAHLLKGPTSPPFPDCVHSRQQPVACQDNIMEKMAFQKSAIHRKKGSAKQSIAELASKLAETASLLPEVAAKLPRPPVAGTEVTFKNRNGTSTKLMSSDQLHRKPSLLPTVPEGKPSVVSPVHSRESVAQCERDPSSSNSATLPPVAQQRLQREKEQSMATSHPHGHSRLKSKYHCRDQDKAPDKQQGGVPPMGSLLNQYDRLFSRCSELKNYFTVLQQHAERGRVFEGKSNGKVNKELLKTVQEAIRLRAEVDSFNRLSD